MEFTLFFSDKLKAFDRMENPTVFKYEDFDFIVIKIYLDNLHCLETENVSNYHLCELLKFLKFEGKTGKKSDKDNRITSLELSPYDAKMYKMVLKTLVQAMAKMDLQEQVLIGVMMNSIDPDFHKSEYMKVRQFYKLKIITIFRQWLLKTPRRKLFSKAENWI